ncbi:cytochrome ubiquinol oxidase subunit I [Catenovulum sediminis]|uniref:Cytochrome ubiquinol oxidase subunit I n=1 Tax=Catenovulum sediminis TaxID=1740262 RepID=A0ABV1RFH8_9ALTE
MLDTLILSRIQFAANISFHILFPTITIALAWFLFYFKLRFNLSGDPVWMRVYRFWVKIFALTFALGVVSGITMSFQFGTNWPGFMETVGNIAGPLLGYEVLTAFFLEATFLGIMLFGIHRVAPWVHTFATLVVAVGTSLSAFWILSLNSWMHTPSGYQMIDGVAHVTSWFDVVFNPSFPYRFTHMLLASFLTASFVIAGLSAYRILRGDNKRAPKLALKTALTVAALVTPLQIFVGDMHGVNTLEHQPQKIAAMEGVWQTETHAPLLLFAIPDESKRTNHFELGIPGLASLILTHDFAGEIKGLDEFVDKHPPVFAVFWAFRVMLLIGMLMLLISWLCRWQLSCKGELSVGLLKILTAMTFSGWIATLAGWYVTEIGRQPYLVSGVLTVEQAATDIAPGNVAISLSLYLLVYAILMLAYLHTVFLMARRAVEIEEISQAELEENNLSNRQDMEARNV